MPAAPQAPVIVLPGITATTLHDLYPVEPEEVWTALLNKDYTRIALHPDDVRYEAREPARVSPFNPFGLVYGDLVESLRHELTAKADRPTPVFGFGYDWRQDATRTADRLDEFIDEVLARTALLPHYRQQPPRAVDLVGHSLGGLVTARYLWSRQQAGTESKVRRVVTMAAPFRGAIDAMQKLSMGMGSLTGPDPKAREREAARTIPAVYQLLPSYPGAVSFDPGVTKNIFDIKAWQPSILATLREYIRLQKARITVEALLAQYLAVARSFIDSVNAIDPAKVLPEKDAGWLAIVGVNVTTQVQAQIVLERGRPRFAFPPPVNRYSEPPPGNEQTGDHTVPFRGACPDFLDRERLVCVTMDDLSFWEVRDRLLAEFAGLHSFLPKINHVQRLTARFLRDDLGWRLEARPAPGVAAASVKWPAWLRPKH
jgi:pimeloyl-ACP methyl ester carboxylesterase